MSERRRGDGTTGGVGRRGFLAGGAAATGLLAARGLLRSQPPGSEIRLGMIGCGGRGNWIADLFVKEGNFRFTACADYFADRAERFGDRHGVERSRRFSALSGYRRVLESPVDAVVIETPPYFHPGQAAAAVEAGKHVFLAKPIAVDVPGCETIEATGKRATENHLAFLVDFQTRADPFYREAVRRVHAGDIGRLICCDSRYPWAGGRMPAPENAEDRLRRWYCTAALSGDFIVEQSIHSLDVATWFLDADPVRAFGAGGSKGLRGHGDIWDHFSVVFTFPGDVAVSFQSVQAIPGVPDAIPCRVYGSRGVVDTDYFSHVWIRGEIPHEGGKLENLYTSGAVRNIRHFHRLVVEGIHDNVTVTPSVRSNLTCILGRTAAYENRVVTWQELLRKQEPLEFDLGGLRT